MVLANILKTLCLFYPGVMGPDVVNVPLYLSQLRMARVIGLKNTSTQKWRGYLEELERFSSYLKYDKEYGNQSKIKLLYMFKGKYIPKCMILILGKSSVNNIYQGISLHLGKQSVYPYRFTCNLI